MNNSVVEELLKISEKSSDDIINRNDIIKFVNDVRNILFLGYNERIEIDIKKYVANKLVNIEMDLLIILSKIKVSDVRKKISDFINCIPKIKSQLNGDLKAFLSSDPAVTSEQEIIICYPGFYAISFYRIANCLSMIGIPMIPRIISEHAHSKTGIDIHPNAEIKDNFFIDHGTGVVIGETSIIGNNVKIYQGVTLGAISLSNVEELKNVKRHPTLEDNVTVYSSTSILGGQTVIGENSVIGSNLFITKSIERNSKVVFTNFDQLHKKIDLGEKL